MQQISEMDDTPMSGTPRSTQWGRETLAESYGLKSSPLRAEFKTDGSENGDQETQPRFHPDTSHTTSHFGPPTSSDFAAPPSGFQLREAPPGVRSGSAAPAPTLRPLPTQRASESAANGFVRRKLVASGTQTPPDRRSVQFASPEDSDTASAAAAEGQDGSAPNGDLDDGEELRGRQSSLLARLKALTTPTSGQPHTRQSSHGGTTPTSERDDRRLSSPAEHGSEEEGDAEDSAEDGAIPTAKRQKMKRHRRPEGANGTEASTPRATPKSSRLPSFLREGVFTSTPTGGANGSRPDPFPRSATMGNIPENARAGVSEDEGRDRFAKSAWRRGIEGARGMSYKDRRQNTDTEAPAGHRPMTFRRLTEMAGLDGGASPSRPKTDRQGSTSAQRWRQVKTGLKLLGQKKKDERVKVDYQKSAELMAELIAGSPAALVLASMYQRDEHGHKKIPVLLEQLKVTIPASQTRKDESSDRHQVFTINLEYGNGPSRMKWTIYRSVRDFANLHAKYKLHVQTERYIQLKGKDRRRAKIPHFPTSSFPYARNIRGLADESEGEDEEPANGSARDTDASGNDRPAHKKRKSYIRRKSSSSQVPMDGVTGALAGAGAMAGAVVGAQQQQRNLYADRQRRKLEHYLQQMIRWLVFRPESTRICKFLELSALAMRLSIEGGFHGKEGLMQVASSMHVEGSKLLAIKNFPNRMKTLPDRHKPKWFLVRHSYIVAVDAPESIVPTEVFIVDSDFSMGKRRKRLYDQTPQEQAKVAKASSQPKQHILKLYNAERKLRLVARNERQLAQFKESIDIMQKNTIWAQKQRFDSFAPVRKNVFARWLVDGRDHMWQVSHAIDNARSFVYIHDWWLSPELYLRRPAAISQKWRLDRLLLRKAQQGVKIFIIVYRNIESATPITSEYTKAAMLDLHPNVCIQRSPNQFRQNQFFYAHHEKLVVVDNAMAFVGGVDLCFGRWDDPSHSLTDDKVTGFDADMTGPRNIDTCQMWPGKDYSNPRVQDFYSLERPYEEMYDRQKVPRMPWHDIAMTIVGQPARDIGRHFVQRWNYILRQRTPTRPTPTLLPPPDFEQEELDKLGMNGTCQIQMLRSCTSWSIGTPNKTECSIMNAYVSLIQNSLHFVYIENQFFITSCTVEGTTIHNKIGDALVERIELAYKRGDNWRACIVIPLMPGFQNTVDAQDGSSVRLIMQCQFRSICRGDTSIFGRLRAKGIEPQQYIEFYALRQWGKIGPQKCVTTEQLYIHAKCMIVDDRHCIIGSANINERSMLGSRDSEVAAVVTDQEMIPSFMGGEPFEVGTFPHTLRMRLMREHLGIDVDAFYEERGDKSERSSIDLDTEHAYGDGFSTPPAPPLVDVPDPMLSAPDPHAHGASSRTNGEITNLTGKSAPSADMIAEHETAYGKYNKKTFPEQHELDVAGYGTDNMARLEAAGDVGFRDSYVNAQGREVIRASVAGDAIRRPSIPLDHPHHHVHVVPDPHHSPTPPWNFPRMDTRALGLTLLSQLPPLPVLDDTDIGGPPLTRKFSAASASHVNPLLESMRRPIVTDDCMRDPLADNFYSDIWHVVAENNTRLYRQVFRCQPDSEVQSWREYREFNAYNEKFMQSQGLGVSKPKPAKEAPGTSGPPGFTGPDILTSAGLAHDKVNEKASSRLGDLGNKLMHRPTSKDTEASEKQRLEHGGSPRFSEAPTTAADEQDEKAAQRATDDETATAVSAQAAAPSPRTNDVPTTRPRTRTVTIADTKDKEKSEKSHDPNHPSETSPTHSTPTPAAAALPTHQNSQRRRRRATTKSSGGRPPAPPEDVLSKFEAEELLKLVQGNLVQWPYQWLEKEEKGGNWLYNIDQIAPLEIYD